MSWHNLKKHVLVCGVYILLPMQRASILLLLFTEIVKGNDLSSLSAKKVRRALESRFNADFTDRLVPETSSKRGAQTGGNMWDTNV